MMAEAGWVLALRALRQVLSIVVVAVLVRVISQEQFGRYQFILTLIGLCSAFTLPGMQRAIIQSVARGHRGTFTAGTRLTFRYSILGAGFLLCTALWSHLQGDDEQALALVVAMALFPGSQGLNQWQSLQIGSREFRANTIRGSIGVVGSSAAVIGAAWLGFTSIPALVAATFGLLVVQNIYQQRIALNSIKAEDTVEPGSISYGLRSSIWDAVNLVANWVDRLFLFILGSPEALAAYAVADRIPEVLKVNIQQLMSVLIPRFATRNEYAADLDRKLNLAAITAAGGLLVFAFAIVPWLIPFLYTEAYGHVILYCQLILISIAIGSFAIVKNAYVGAKLDLPTMRNITLWTSAVRILSSATLVWRFGALGAAASTIVYRIATVVVVNYYIRRYRRE